MRSHEARGSLAAVIVYQQRLGTFSHARIRHSTVALSVEYFSRDQQPIVAARSWRLTDRRGRSTHEGIEIGSQRRKNFRKSEVQIESHRGFIGGDQFVQ